MSTKIEWTDETWNPVTGCTKVSQGCKHCYAERLWPKVSAAEAKREQLEQRRPFTQIRCHDDRLTHPTHWNKPRRVFVNSMSDLFHENVPFEFIDKTFAVMNRFRQHTYQILTKRPARMLEYLSDRDVKGRVLVAGYEVELCAVEWIAAWPLPNVWIGVSVEDQATADERIPLLLRAPAAVRFISAEPLLGPIDLIDTYRRGPFHVEDAHHPKPFKPLHGLDWVIAGGESGPKARPSHPRWYRELRDTCTAAGVPFFFKQWGEFACVAEWSAEEESDPESDPTRLLAVDQSIRLVDNPRGGLAFMRRVGKSKAGRVLDEHVHDAYPVTPGEFT